MEDTTIIVIDETGKELTMEILFTFEDDRNHKNYVLYFDPNDDSGEVFASAYDEEGNLIPVTSEEEWAMIEEVFEAFNFDNADSEDEEEEVADEKEV
jgi:uncharacterized protein YrzB (UPF0473 family)